MAWAPVAIGLCALYLPTFLAFSRTIWETEEQAHGPLIVAVVIWLLWDKRQFFIDSAGDPRPGIGWLLLSIGLLGYVLGRSQSIPLLDIGSFIPIAFGILLAMKGWPGVRALWFPVLFFAFAIPLPGLIVDAATGPLKQTVSAVAESILYATGYPIARSGVILNVGQYQLLVADACSGLNSMFSLSALGLLYLYLMRYRSYLHIGLILLSILPIAFAANIVRVMILVLVTYHLGDEAGQGFIHGFAGMVLFIAALLMLFAFDGVLRMAFRQVRTA
jgi:exosortase B